MEARRPILFYDGECGLCARTVQWCLKRDRRGVLSYAPLQGDTYARLDVAGKPRELETMVLSDADGLHTRDEATLRVMKLVGGVWPFVARVCRIVPRTVRVALYDYVARHRIAWFGTAEQCELPSAPLRERFLA